MKLNLHISTPIPRLELIAETQIESALLEGLQYMGPLETDVFKRLDLTVLNLLLRRIPDKDKLDE